MSIGLQTGLLGAQPQADRFAGLGAELVPNPSLTGTLGQEPLERNVVTNGTCNIANTSPPPGYSQYVEIISGDGGYDRMETSHSSHDLTVEIGKTYRVQALVRHISGVRSAQGLRAFTFTDGSEDATLTQDSGWHWISVDTVATSTSGKTRLYASQDGEVGDQVDCAYLSVREVL